MIKNHTKRIVRLFDIDKKILMINNIIKQEIKEYFYIIDKINIQRINFYGKNTFRGIQEI